MKRITPLILVWTALITACAPGSNSGNRSPLGSTGYTSPEGDEYVTNGDERVAQALKETPAAPSEPVKPVAGKSLLKPLRERLKEFEIARFQTRETAPSRFGEDRLTLKFIFRDRPSLVFNTQLIGSKPKFNANGVSDGFTLAGELNDGETQTRGEFTLTENKTGETAKIFYWAYKARLKVRANREQVVAAGSEAEQQMNQLRENTFGWVNNWSVLQGVSFYLVDIIKVVPQGGAPAPSLLSFRGASLRTGDATHETEELSGPPSDIRLVGNAEEGTGRMFQVTMQDSKTKQKNEFMLDVELEPGSANPQTPGAPTDPVEEPEIEAANTAPPTAPTPGAPQTAGHSVPPPEVAPNSGKSYLRISPSLPRTSKMTADFNRNRNLNGVKKFIQAFTTGVRRPDLQRFYSSANPFRRIMEKVGQYFDVSPAYAYLTVVESAYFTAGQYRIEKASKSTALGPFQLLIDTAREQGVMVDGPGDERRFFVPSACGAAKYIRKLVDKFKDSDATVAILGYYQGDGGAAAAIYCSFDANAGDRQACAQRINRSFNRRDYGRFLSLTKKYDYTYAEMDRMAAIPAHMREYVNKKLAVYFISNDLQKYGFSLNNAASSLPNNGTIVPSRAMKDRECQTAVSGLL